MRRQTHTVLLGVFTAAALTALGVGLWPSPSPMSLSVPLMAAEEEALPLPPEPPRLADSAEFERCFAMLRDDPEGARAYALMWDSQGGGDGARHCHALALLALGEPVQAAQRLEALAGRSRAGHAARSAVYSQATQAWLMAGDANRAVGSATLALTLTPDDVDALVDRALALGITARFRESIEDLDRALNLDPGRVEALVFRAAAWRQLDNGANAMRDITRALALDPGNAEALLERGILRQMRGDTAGAREDWARAIELSPLSATADLAAQNLALNEVGPARR